MSDLSVCNNIWSLLNGHYWKNLWNITYKTGTLLEHVPKVFCWMLWLSLEIWRWYILRFNPCVIHLVIILEVFRQIHCCSVTKIIFILDLIQSSHCILPAPQHFNLCAQRCSRSVKSLEMPQPTNQMSGWIHNLPIRYLGRCHSFE